MQCFSCKLYRVTGIRGACSRLLARLRLSFCDSKVLTVAVVRSFCGSKVLTVAVVLSFCGSKALTVAVAFALALSLHVVFHWLFTHHGQNDARCKQMGRNRHKIVLLSSNDTDKNAGQIFQGNMRALFFLAFLSSGQKSNTFSSISGLRTKTALLFLAFLSSGQKKHYNL